MGDKSTLDITFWNRLESRSSSKQLEKGLRNEVHDGLWLLGRQWQTGEFDAEDTGSPVFACMEWDVQEFRRVALTSNASKDINPGLPLETEVERVQFEPDLLTQIEMGRHFRRMIFQQFETADAKAIITQFRTVGEGKFTFNRVPAETKMEQFNNANLLKNRSLLQTIEIAIHGGALDGYKIFTEIQLAGSTASLIGTQSQELDQVGVAFVNWFRSRYAQPDDVNEDGWLPERMEYQFKVAAPSPLGGHDVFAAKEYYNGRLDWYALERTQRESTDDGSAFWGESPIQTSPTKKRRHLIPSELEFPGMPGARWWEFEDRRINFSAIDSKINELASMTMVEFGLLYSNDWFMVPLRVPVGSFIDIDQMIVTDVFGQKIKINHHQEALPTPYWSFFNDLLVPPVVMDLMESKAIEEVCFGRDEMANMVWGIEQRVADGLGGSKNGQENAHELTNYLKLLEEKYDGEKGKELLPNEAKIRYQIATAVPENWIPFIPVREKKDGIDDPAFRQITLRRAAMPRFLRSFPTRRVRPLTQLLQYNSGDPDHPFYDLREEEIPRSGITVRKTWQRTRWYNGKTALWLGYRKLNGFGERNSGLQFDQAIPKTD